MKINLALHKILEVNLAGGTLKLAVWLRLEWSGETPLVCALLIDPHCCQPMGPSPPPPV